MIPILKRFRDSFYMVLVDDKILPAFLTEYVFNCPELTTIKFQGITQTDGEVEVKFLKFPEGFAYINPPTEQHRFFHPTSEASKTDHTEFFLRPGTHQK
ncbi:hypothetical protein TNCV_86931 [Trichonephila clavipes]|nr:hypothetical protein TNCV_86931 [Trichonephila clavipes]